MDNTESRLARNQLDRVFHQLRSARENIVALSTEPDDAGSVTGYLKACPHPADARELTYAYNHIVDAEVELLEALK